MGWRIPNRSDLVATLSQGEMDAFAASSDFSDDVVGALLLRTGEWARNYLRRNASVKLCPEPGSLPEGCISKAMDYAAFDVLKRLDLPPNEARAKAVERAEAFFAEIAAMKVMPESYVETDEESKAGEIAVAPASAHVSPPRLLD